MEKIKFNLRKFRKGDEKSLQENINDKMISKTTESIPYPYTIKNARYWVRQKLKENKQKKPKVSSYVIDIDGEVAGSTSFHDINYKHRKSEIGYWLARKYWNKGIMTNAVKQMVKIGFKDLKLLRIYAYVYAGNNSSGRVLEKAGFKFEGLLKKYHIKDGKSKDCLLYAKIR